MKIATKDCIMQDKFLEENQQYCMGVIPKVRSFTECCAFIADLLLDALVHDTQDKRISFAVGRALPMWKKENFLDASKPDAYQIFHRILRTVTLRKMIDKLDPKEKDKWLSDLSEIEAAQ